MRSGFGRISRRDLLLGGGVLTAAGLAGAQSKGGPIWAYAGVFSAVPGREEGGSHGQGIFLFSWDASSGKLTQRRIIEDPLDPQWMVLNPAGTHLYVAHNRATAPEPGPPAGGGRAARGGGRGAGGAGEGGRGVVAAYAVDKSNGNLTLINSVPAEGSPAHMSVHPSGKYVFGANYGGGTAVVIPVLPSGELGPATDVKHSEGKVGSIHAASGPPGSFSISGHNGPHIHGIIPDPSGRYVFANDLGYDRMYIWKFDVATGKLSPNDPPNFDFPSGDGPRHLVFHPNNKWLYSVQEESSTVTAFDFDVATGKLKEKQTLSTLPKGFAGTNFPSEIVMSPDSRFVYAVNRLHDSVAIFAIKADGTLTFLDAVWTRGDYPRSITLEPTGNFLYSLNQRSDDITTFRVNKRNGGLTFTGEYNAVGSPAVMVFTT